jgi:hypothetical protein
MVMQRKFGFLREELDINCMAGFDRIRAME